MEREPFDPDLDGPYYHESPEDEALEREIELRIELERVEEMAQKATALAVIACVLAITALWKLAG